MNYKVMYLSDLRKERKLAKVEGKNLEVMQIEAELIRRAQDRYFHKKNAEFEQAKKTYLTAKVAYDMIKEKLGEMNAPIEKALNDGKISVDKWARQVTHNEFKLGEPEIFRLKIEAKKALFAIAQKLLQQFATPAQWEKLKIAYTDGPKYSHLREELIDITLRWNPTK